MFNVGGGMNYDMLLKMLQQGGNTPGQPIMESASPLSGMSGPSMTDSNMPMFDVTPPQPPVMSMGGGSPMSVGSGMGMGMGATSRPMSTMGSSKPPMAKPAPPEEISPMKAKQRGSGGGIRMGNPMSTERPGFWGKYNQISQAFQPQAMRMLGL